MFNTFNRVSGGMTARTVPVDIYKNTDSLVIVAGPLPGIVPESVDITVNGSEVTIQAETHPDHTIPESAYVQRERYFGPVKRHLSLPVAVNPEGITARLKQDVLTITIKRF